MIDYRDDIQRRCPHYATGHITQLGLTEESLMATGIMILIVHPMMFFGVVKQLEISSIWAHGIGVLIPYAIGLLISKKTIELPGNSITQWISANLNSKVIRLYIPVVRRLYTKAWENVGLPAPPAIKKIYRQ